MEQFYATIIADMQVISTLRDKWEPETCWVLDSPAMNMRAFIENSMFESNVGMFDDLLDLRECGHLQSGTRVAWITPSALDAVLALGGVALVEKGFSVRM